MTTGNKSVGLQIDRNIADGCVHKPRWVFPAAAMPRRTSYASNTKFSLCHFPACSADAMRH